MKKENVKEIIIKLVLIVVASFLYGLGIKRIVQPKNFLSGGVAGFTVLVSRYVSIKLDKAQLESLLYSILYIAFNVPIIIFGLKKVGKQFIYYSIINVVLFSTFVSVIPSTWFYKLQLDSLDMLTSAIVVGLLCGVSSVICFLNGFSTGGTDIISMYLSRTKGKGIGSYNFVINAFILLIGGIVFKDFASLIYTIIYFFINTLVINNLYIGHKKVLMEIITNKSDILVDKLMEESNHGCTILDVVGAYSKKEKKMLRIVIASNQTRRICEKIRELDKDSFTTLVEVKQVAGKFYVPPIK